MALQNTLRRAGPFTGTGLVSTYPFAFKVFAETDVAVTVSSDPNGLIEETLKLNADYTVSLNEDQDGMPGGSITLATSLAADTRLTIISVVPADQQMELTNHDGFFPTVLNTAFDKVTALIQQLAEKAGRTVTVPATSTETPEKLLSDLLGARDASQLSAEEAAQALALCEEIKQNIFQYSWDIPHVVETLRDVENYPYDGYFWVKGYGNPGVAGEDISNRVVKASGSTELRTLGERFSDVVNVKDFGAVGDGVTDDTEAFEKLESVKTGTRVNLCGETFLVENFPDGNYYYNGTFIRSTDNVVRKAHDDNVYRQSSDLTGMGAPHPNFVIIGNFAPQDINHKALNGVVALGNSLLKTMQDKEHRLVNTIAIGDGVMTENVVTGDHNMGVGTWALHNVSTGDRNVAFGTLALQGVTTGRCNVGFGRDTGQTVTSGANNTFLGYAAGSGYAPIDLSGTIVAESSPVTGNGNTCVGVRSGQNIAGEASSNTFIGLNAGRYAKQVRRSVAIGAESLGFLDEAVSYNSKVLSVVSQQCTYTQSGTTITVNYAGHAATVGQYVGITFTSGETLTQGSPEKQILYVTSVTENSFTVESPKSLSASGSCTVDEVELATTVTAADTLTVLGTGAGRQVQGGSSAAVILGAYPLSDEACVVKDSEIVGSYTATGVKTITASQVLGRGVASNAQSITNSTIAGYYSCLNATGTIDSTIAIGRSTFANVASSKSSTAVGFGAGMVCSGESRRNTALGDSALRMMQDGSTSANIVNSTGIGSGARVSGSNQVQLGNSDTTVYAYGAVQDRSDARDKADVRDTILGSDFILSLRPVDFRWDMRDDYIETVEREFEVLDEEGNPVPQIEFEVIRHEKDGSRKRTRYHHGFIAQEVQETMSKLGVDFGGFQDHKVNGGSDVLSLGYEELIAPMVKTIQELNARIKNLEEKVL